MPGHGRSRGRVLDRVRRALPQCAARPRRSDHVIGYTLINDVSARDWVEAFRRTGDPDLNRMGKQLPGFCPMGPVIATRDEIADPHDVRMVSAINGSVMQDSDTSDLIWKIPELIAYYSRWYRFMPGDILTTGSPAGVGLWPQSQDFPEAGRCRIGHGRGRRHARRSGARRRGQAEQGDAPMIDRLRRGAVAVLALVRARMPCHGRARRRAHSHRLQHGSHRRQRAQRQADTARRCESGATMSTPRAGCWDARSRSSITTTRPIPPTFRLSLRPRAPRPWKACSTGDYTSIELVRRSLHERQGRDGACVDRRLTCATCR